MAEYIERQAVLDALQAPEIFNITPHHIELIKQIPFAKVAPVRYATLYLNKHSGDYECSACGEDFTMLTQWMTPNYCPNCGAKMNGGDSDEAD